MTAAGRRVRLAAVALVLGALLWGSVRGGDHDFPVGPFRMYATSGKANGVVTTPALVAVVDGRPERVPPELFGLRRAELEGQLNRFREPEDVLRALVGTFRARDGRELDELRIVHRKRRLRDGERVGPTESVVIATWRPPR